MILCCGEALIDMLPDETRRGEASFTPHPGGAVFNTAVALGRLGARAGFFSGLSNDPFGQLLQALLDDAGVDTTMAQRSDRPTTLAFVQFENGQPIYSFYDQGSAGRMLSPEDLPDVPDQVQALFFGGISLVGDPCGAAYDALMTRAAPNHVTMIDPNIRPAFVAGVQPYRLRLERMLARADIVKLSDEDLRWLEGSGDPHALARSYLTRGAKLVLLTKGAQGATAITRTQEVFVPAEQVPIVDTVGAGDTFNAGILAALQQAGNLSKQKLAKLDADSLRSALIHGQKAAAITVARAGANPPWKEELCVH